VSIASGATPSSRSRSCGLGAHYKLFAEVVVVILLVAHEFCAGSRSRSTRSCRSSSSSCDAHHLVGPTGGITHGEPHAEVLRGVSDGLHTDLQPKSMGGVGAVGLLLLLLRAYSLGGRHLYRHRSRLQRPRHHARSQGRDGKRTMTYMAISLAVTAGGILLCYLALRRAAGAGLPRERSLLEDDERADVPARGLVLDDSAFIVFQQASFSWQPGHRAHVEEQINRAGCRRQ